MTDALLQDHSPYQPTARPGLCNATNVILIDNYDSFTWNIYQYLTLEGATVTVYRNDEITLQELIAKTPSQLVISPGPGHPDNDAGVSNEAIRHFAGKIPILGVCLGEQCIYSIFGGRVEVTGEILHGKTSQITHDGKGVYAGLPQAIPVTRYHSLAGTHLTLPASLQVSSWTVSADGSTTIIMGIRHRELTVEGVQFHPESILTAQGRPMLYNFLRLKGGTWAENESMENKLAVKSADQVEHGGVLTEHKKQSILDEIFEHRKAAVALQKQLPSYRMHDLLSAHALNVAPPLLDFVSRLKSSPYLLSLMAEFKRASPSKGIISLDISAPAQARTYALAGASVISVLTEPKWFKGSIEDLRTIRLALDGMKHRPAVLRKEFVFDEYQILEARLAGADTVLLIVKMLDEILLTKLYCYSQSLGMEPLVEVNNEAEMKIAAGLGCKVIGVNNRNLTNFRVDLETTSRLMNLVPQDAIVCALSGIAGPKDVEPYLRNGVGAVLVGEALMKAPDTTQFIKELLGLRQAARPESKKPIWVKICGTRTPEAAITAVEAGADAVGIILVTGRKRCVPTDTALSISKAVHQTRRPCALEPETLPSLVASDALNTSMQQLYHPKRALLVGVFQNQTLEYVLEQQVLLDLDVVQFHGSEPIEWARLVPVPVIRSFRPGDVGIGTRGYHAAALLDSGTGGSGTGLDPQAVKTCLEQDNGLCIVLAGGLSGDNVSIALASFGKVRDRIVGVDVSSGVEEKGQQSIELIKRFVAAAKVSMT